MAALRASESVIKRDRTRLLDPVAAPPCAAATASILRATEKATEIRVVCSCGRETIIECEHRC